MTFDFSIEKIADKPTHLKCSQIVIIQNDASVKITDVCIEKNEARRVGVGKGFLELSIFL